jgi:hypothetical protein
MRSRSQNGYRNLQQTVNLRSKESLLGHGLTIEKQRTSEMVKFFSLFFLHGIGS